ncbi:uncharacterized protein LOC134856632 [Symsagittifera roscoffensis]|uniref:uncharacterized protein LOC134856632 n=1 Tax=Symsagittifera roscoffensis TaxID=84072 RepID=UPI00307B4348
MPLSCAQQRARRKGRSSLANSGNCPDCGRPMHVCLLDGGYVTEGVGSLFSTPKFGEIELLIQEEPTKEEQVIHEEIKATMPVYQSAAVDALRSFSREKGGEFILTEKEGGRQSNLQDLVIAFAQEWPVGSIESEKRKLCVISLTADDFDSRGDIKFKHKSGQQLWRGGMHYFQPNSGWIRVGLKCMDRYDGNNDWLAMNGNPNEWAVGFHGSDQKGTELIAQTRIFKEGKRQHYQYSEDINEKSNNRGKLCGKGIYFGSQIEIAERFSNFKSDNKTCVLQVRMKPDELRIPKDKTDYRIVQDAQFVRPYGLCLKYAPAVEPCCAKKCNQTQTE